MAAPARTLFNPVVVDGRLTYQEYSPTTAPVLVPGVVSLAMQDVQAFLKQRGLYHGTVDGFYGQKTYLAIVSFQKSRNLTPDGRIGPQTWKALLSAYDRTVTEALPNRSKYSVTTAPVLKMGSTGSAVRDIQTFLKRLGLYTGPVDGIYAPSTAKAVKAYQYSYKSLRDDGVVGKNTWSVILHH
jgi:peptidoglycan hydrolase-like protein with peptidoglycan-binding domain